ncbi:uncharacterized protein LOC127718256 isoform X2 [Mytilus californianus]|uniref:uncharacterized protein LOC127718256 isoform X2 n=1 Tax=Mytilus californianus TaxID=6549 RepID=UPI002246056E|nr:uncharacterized protein LOC127718256 isoform X2 [Mytilus californianus]
MVTLLQMIWLNQMIDYPKVHIAEGSSLQLVEGHRLNLTCTVDDETNVNVEWFYLDENGNLLNLHQSNKAFILQTVTRNDTGVYQCQATNRIGNSSSTVNITIQYPPAVELVVSEDFIECILHQGIPASNNLFQLEHQSVFGVHIREIHSFSSDKLLLLKSYIPYETNGIYVCQASNGVVDVDGFAIHNKSTIFKHSGRPVFSNENTNVLYGELGKPFLMKFIIYSFPILQELRPQKKFGNHSTNQNVGTDQTMKSLLSYTEYDTKEKIPGYEVIYEKNILTNEDFTVYNLWAKNSFGESFYMYKIIALDKVDKSRHMKIHFLVSVSISALLVLYIGVSHFHCLIRSSRSNRLDVIQENSYDEIDVVPYELDNIQQPVDDVHDQSYDGNSIDSNVSRQNVTENNSTMQLLQTRPTDSHRIAITMKICINQLYAKETTINVTVNIYVMFWIRL